MEFLKDWIIQIDFDEGRLDVLAPGTERDREWGESVPFVYDTTGEILVLATLDDNVRAPFMVDTGAACTGLLEESLLARLVGSHEARVAGDEKGVGLSGMYASQISLLSHFSVGPFRHENLRFTSGKQNVLGLDYLSRYRLTIDFPNERLYLAKGKHFARPEHGHTCGLHFFFRAGGLEVESVDERSPAHNAGVRAKDVIVQLYGKPVSQWKSSEVDRMLTTEGKTVQMTVERGGKQMEMSLTPKEFD
jgi:hypothetical protein